MKAQMTSFVNKVKSIFTKDLTSALPMADSENFEARHLLGDDRTVLSLSSRLWLHANQDKQWAIRQLEHAQQSTRMVESYVGQLSHLNAWFDNPVKILANEAANFTLLDWISVEKALIQYQVELLTSGPVMPTEEKRTAIRTLKRHGKTPNWLLNLHDTFLSRYYQGVRNDGASHTFLSMLVSFTFSMITSMLWAFFTPADYWSGFTVFLMLLTLTVGGSIFAHVRALMQKKSIKNLAWFGTVSKSWDAIFAAKTPQDCVFLQQIAYGIPAHYIIDKENYECVRLSAWKPSEVVLASQVSFTSAVLSAISRKKLLRPANVAAPENLIAKEILIRQAQF